jgi:L,D-transpeptidase YcbB
MAIIRQSCITLLLSSIISVSVSANEPLLTPTPRLLSEQSVNTRQPSISESVVSPESALQQQKSILWVKEVADDLSSIQYIDKLAQLYASIAYTPIWQDAFAATELEEQLRIVALSGISSDLSRRYSQLKHYKLANDWRQYDLLATDTLLAYMSYIENLPEFGRAWLFGTGVDIPLPLPTQIQTGRLLDAVDNNRMRYFVTSLKPVNDSYNKMILAMQSLELLEAEHWPGFYQQGIIRLGDRLKNPDSLITILERMGDITEYDADRMRTSQLRSLTIPLSLGVKTFQKRHGLKTDGVIGPKTRYWLAMTPKERIRVLALNAQRVRLWPAEYNSVLIVNIPDYELNLWLDNKHVFDSKVIVGRPSRRTPLMSSRVNSVVFNPYWNVPKSIMRKDILPKARRDRSYLYRHNYAVIRSWNSSEQIPIHTIHPSMLNAKTFPYRLRQKPGNKNALGLYKFNTPNDNAIYLHDTPAKSLFNEDDRAFSSGCVRVENADVLALILLNYSGVTDQRFYELAGRKKTKTVGLRNKVKVHLIYQTAWVDDGGLVNFRDDVYLYDKVGAGSQSDQKYTSAYNH